MNALVSIHDVMPHTFERVERILGWLSERGVPPATLLVVPGRPWNPEQIDKLRELAREGYELAAHGWRHETRPKHIYHRIHAALISRNVAEHLDLNSQGIRQLMQKSKDWFGENDLPLPDFYVPPAWALGPISKSDLAGVPYQLIETTRGLLRRKGPREWALEKLPLTGYEADNALREFFLRRWNAAQAKQAGRQSRALRISIHPDDLELRVADQLAQQVRSVETFRSYHSELRAREKRDGPA